MVVLYPDQLPEKERARLLEVLSDAPIAAEPADVTSTWLVAAFGADVLLGYLQWSRDLPAGRGWGAPLLLALTLGIAVALVFALVVEARRRSRIAQAPHRCGRFVLPFGYVEATPDRVLLLPGREISSLDVEVGRPSPSGASVVTVTVARGRWRRRVRFRGMDLDVPAEKLDAVLRAQWEKPDGYRASRAPFASHVPRPRVDRALGLAHSACALAGVVTFALAWTVALPRREARLAALERHPIERLQRVERRFPMFPWVHALTGAAIAERDRAVVGQLNAEVRDPWRAELLEVFARAQRGERVAVDSDRGVCTWTRSMARHVDRWLHAHTPDGATDVADFDHFFGRTLRSGWLSHLQASLGERVRWWPGARGDGGHAMTVGTRCELTPREVVDLDGRWFVAIETTATVTLAVAGRAPLTTTVVVPPPTVVAGSPGPVDWYGDWEIGLAAAVSAHVEGEMFREIPGDGGV